MKLFDFDEVEYNSVEGNFVKMERTRYGKFDYWLLQLEDKTNLLNILFPLTSGLFVRLLRLLVGRKFRYVEIYLNPAANVEERITVLLDGVQVEPQPLELPKIKKMFAMKNRRVVEYHCYDERILAIETIVEAINAYNPHR